MFNLHSMPKAGLAFILALVGVVLAVGVALIAGLFYPQEQAAGMAYLIFWAFDLAALLTAVQSPKTPQRKWVVALPSLLLLGSLLLHP